MIPYRASRIILIVNMQHIYLIRHGQSTANASHIIAGQQESPLSELGKQEAWEAARQADMRLIDLIVSSPMQRTKQTAEIIARGINYPLERIVFISELIERNLGSLEGKNYEETPYGNGNTVAAEDVPGIEPIELFFERTKTALGKIHTLSGKNILVVCHNGTGRMLKVIHEGGAPLDLYDQPRLENAVLYELED